MNVSGDFRGTKDGLKKLIDDQRFHRPLMLDIWQFYRAERLYLLQASFPCFGFECLTFK